jgi:hypothetical protein
LEQKKSEADILQYEQSINLEIHKYEWTFHGLSPSFDHARNPPSLVKSDGSVNIIQNDHSSTSLKFN